MVAAEITATVIGRSDSPLTIVSGGSNRRLKRLYLEGPKATTSDWFLLTNYLTTAESTQIVGWEAVNEESNNAQAVDVITYDSGDAKFTLTAAEVGTSRVLIDYYE